MEEISAYKVNKIIDKTSINVNKEIIHNRGKDGSKFLE